MKIKKFISMIFGWYFSQVHFLCFVSKQTVSDAWLVVDSLLVWKLIILLTFVFFLKKLFDGKNIFLKVRKIREKQFVWF